MHWLACQSSLANQSGIGVVGPSSAARFYSLISTNKHGGSHTYVAHRKSHTHTHAPMQNIGSKQNRAALALTGMQKQEVSRPSATVCVSWSPVEELATFFQSISPNQRLESRMEMGCCYRKDIVSSTHFPVSPTLPVTSAAAVRPIRRDCWLIWPSARLAHFSL